jgi:hypothetical protein
MNTRLSFVASCTALAAVGSILLGGCAGNMPSGAVAATAGSGAVPSVSEAPLLVAPEDIYGRDFGRGVRGHFGGGRGGTGGAFDAAGALSKGR